MPLADYQFSLDGVVFGYGAAVGVPADGFQPDGDEYTVQDNERPSSDSIAFGEDYRTPGDWSWTLHTNDAEDDVAAMAAMKDLELAWRGDATRRFPSKVSELRYAIAGRTRIVYGRPRRWAPSFDNRILSGYREVDCDFRRADTLFYDDEFKTSAVTIVQSVGNGLTAPIISPVTTLQGAAREGTLPAIGGDVPAPFRATINGPVSRPSITGVGWSIELDMVIAAGDTVVISTYPWEMRATLNGNTNVSGRLSANTRLSKARLAPTGETVYFNGIDNTGGATCTIFWRPAYSTM